MAAQIGFGADNSYLIVTTKGLQTGSTGRIQGKPSTCWLTDRSPAAVVLSRSARAVYSGNVDTTSKSP